MKTNTNSDSLNADAQKDAFTPTERNIMDIQLTPIEDIKRPTIVNEWDETVAAIEGLPKKAAQFTVDKVGDDLAKFKRAFRAAANKIERTARFGVDTPDENGTHTTVQVKLTPKSEGRPAGAVNKTSK